MTDSRTTSESSIIVQNLSKSFGSKSVLNQVSFQLNKGENLVIVGKSGSGKSVLIKCLVGLIPPDEGDVSILGSNLNTLSGPALLQLRLRLGFLFQSGALYDSMSVKENLAFPLRQKDKKEEDAFYEEALKNVGLEGILHQMPSELSGGMRKRLGLARTLISQPEILFYDEPTTGLDPITAREISELMVRVQEKYKTSSIIITHDINCAAITANRILALKDGSIYADGTFKDMTSSKDPWIQSLFLSTQTPLNT